MTVKGCWCITSKARLSYEAAGHRLTTEARSDFATHEFSDAKEYALEDWKLLRFRCTGIHLSRPMFVLLLRMTNWQELMSRGLRWLHCWLPGFGWWLRKHWKAVTRCVRCNMRVKGYYRFCPYCLMSSHASETITTPARCNDNGVIEYRLAAACDSRSDLGRVLPFHC